ncbi:MAG: hypothetical protein ACOYEA_06805 [Fermentimonas sp.]
MRNDEQQYGGGDNKLYCECLRQCGDGYEVDNDGDNERGKRQQPQQYVIENVIDAVRSVLENVGVVVHLLFEERHGGNGLEYLQL